MKEIITTKTIQEKKKEKEKEGGEKVNFELLDNKSIACRNINCDSYGKKDSDGKEVNQLFVKDTNYIEDGMLMCPICKGRADADDIEKLKIEKKKQQENLPQANW